MQISRKFRILGQNPIAWFFHSAGRFGLVHTITIMWSVLVDAFFDYRYNTDTIRRIQCDQIPTESDNAKHSAHYGATKAMPFMKLVRLLKLPADSVFVDLGSGKGRAVMLAAKHGFRKVVGVEFSGVLCQTARQNLKNFLKKSPSRSEIEIIESDVTKYILKDDENVFFLFDPFNAPVLQQVLKNIAASLERKPRKIWLIYSSPREQQIVEQSGIFKHSQLYIVIGTEARVYTN